MTTAADLPPIQLSLARAITEIEEHMASAGWDAPVRIFALVRTAAAIERDPAFAKALDPIALTMAQMEPESLSIIEQENLPASTDVEDLLAQLAWPEEVDGVAISMESVTVPAEVEAEAAAMDDADAALAFLHSHPRRSEVRMVAGVRRSGEGWCALRSRAHDSKEDVVQGPELMPGLLEGLRATFA